MAFVSGSPDYESLLNSQKVKIYELVEEAGFDAREFKWDHVYSSYESSLLVDQISHKSGFYFKFDKKVYTNKTYRGAVYSPGSQEMVSSSLHEHWLYILSEFQKWLRFLRRELDAPNLWEEIHNTDFGRLGEGDNTPFSPKELVVVAERVNAVRAFLIKAVAKDKEKISDINSKMDYLIDESKKAKRRDWFMLFTGYIVTNALNWGLSAEHLRQVITLLTKTGMKILGGG